MPPTLKVHNAAIEVTRFVPENGRNYHPPYNKCYLQMKNTHVVEAYQEIADATGGEMSSSQFSATIRINLTERDEAIEWMTKMTEHSKVTYRTTKTVKPSLKRVKCKFVKHFQHQAKENYHRNKRKNQH